MKDIKENRDISLVDLELEYNKFINEPIIKKVFELYEFLENNKNLQSQFYNNGVVKGIDFIQGIEQTKIKKAIFESYKKVNKINAKISQFRSNNKDSHTASIFHDMVLNILKKLTIMRSYLSIKNQKLSPKERDLLLKELKNQYKVFGEVPKSFIRKTFNSRYTQLLFEFWQSVSKRLSPKLNYKISKNC